MNTNCGAAWACGAWRMHEGDRAVFHVEELDCEIKHMALQPCQSALGFLEFHLLPTRPVSEGAQGGEKSPDKKHGKVTGRRLKNAGAGVAGEKPWGNPGVLQMAQRIVPLLYL